MLAPGACIGSVLLTENMCGERSTLVVSCPFPVYPPTVVSRLTYPPTVVSRLTGRPRLLWRTVSHHTPAPSDCLHAANPGLLPRSPKSQLQHAPTACTGGLTSQAGECREAILTTCAKCLRFAFLTLTVVLSPRGI